MAISDMTKVGKECAIAALISTKWGIDCFEKAGFTTPCATIWTCVALRVVCCGVTILLPMSCGNHAAGCPCWEQADAPLVHACLGPAGTMHCTTATTAATSALRTCSSHSTARHHSARSTRACSAMKTKQGPCSRPTQARHGAAQDCNPTSRALARRSPSWITRCAHQ